ncbi:class I SAM-dependent methyltransferase [Phenylobacterium sp.]|uniref:class I SAM-dependent methyltransferase n=1 Tax=Phenylobacterium sp. TaxID=1871053 RepID=UPI00391C6EDB
MKLRALFDKVANRLSSPSPKELAAIWAWCEGRAEPLDAYGESLDPALWAEAAAFTRKLEERGRSLDIEGFGGGAAYGLLYFLVRLRKPAVALETGVAAGWSSEAILAAMAANGGGVLWSSDLPYMRGGREPGVLVSPEHRDRWRLFKQGDKDNLPAILSESGPVEFFHYDSDKSVAGRDWAWRQVRPHLAPDAVVVWDDVQDNWHFRDRMEGRVFRFQRKFVGLVDPTGARS